ncbi:MAG: DUF3604 domain-containing protein [Armatimonadia bacterium]|nr:DUF3604 domain-containing protein [Armatimonadia bacterium]
MDHHEFRKASLTALDRDRVSLEAVPVPAEGMAREPVHQRLELTPRGFDLPAGARILVQITRHWRKHRGNAFRELRTELDTDDCSPHRGGFCLVKAHPPADGDAEVNTEVLDMGFHYVIKMTVDSGAVADGQTLTLYLAEPDGMPIEIPKTRGSHVMQVLVSERPDAPFCYAEEPARVLAHGRPAEDLRLRAPSIAPAGEQTDLRIVAVDAASENPASRYDAKVRVWREGAEDWDTARHSTEAKVSTVSLGTGDEQFTYYQAHDGDNALSTRSNPMGRPEDFGGWNVYLGDLHVHPLGLTEQELREPFEFGRWWSNLDFYSIVWQHNSTNFKFDQQQWLDHLTMADEFNLPGECLAIPGVETYLVQGHRIAYFPSTDAAREFTVAWDRGPEFDLIDPMAGGPWPEAPALWAALEGIEALTVPHHPCYIWPEDWEKQAPEFERCVEVYSRWGTNEVGGECSVQNALSRGHRLGLMAASDNQLAQPGNGPFHMNKGRGLTGVLAPELTRRAVWEAIWARRCYATSGEQMLVYFALGDAPMGSELPVQDGQREFTARAAGTRKLTSVELLRNNEVVARVEPDAMTFDGVLTDDAPIEDVLVDAKFGAGPFCWYYLRVTQEDGHMAWASPIWMA